jgi:hypothetical protein
MIYSLPRIRIRILAPWTRIRIPIEIKSRRIWTSMKPMRINNTGSRLGKINKIAGSRDQIYGT